MKGGEHKTKMTKIQKALAFGSAAVTVFAVNPGSVMAASINLIPTDPNSLGGRASTFNLSGIVATVINIVLVIAAIISFLFLLIGGLQWILAGGDKEGTEKARKRITSALVGLAIIFSAFAIIYVIQNVFGINITNVTVPTVPLGNVNGV